ncbi:MAG: 2-oxoglutarate and iron-dependent oxygenase domain-containing protein [Chloroflexota bacterium]
MPQPTIPTIDISPYLLGTAEQGKLVVNDIRKACEEIGFFIITGHQVSTTLMAEMAEAGQTFFDLAQEEKQQIPASGLIQGGVTYVPFAVEKLAATRGAETPGDLKESLNFGRRLDGAAWPDDSADLMQTIHQYFDAMTELSCHIRAIFATAIGLPTDFFEEAFVDCTSAVRLLNYPAQSSAPQLGQLRAGAHSDYGFLTILRTDDSPGGLQVQHRDGQWLDVPTIPSSFVVNIGDVMMRWTNDHWVSTLHRVVNPPTVVRRSSQRQSIAFFLNPKPEAEIRCLEAFCSNENPAKYPPIRWRDYIAEKSRAAGV